MDGADATDSYSQRWHYVCTREDPNAIICYAVLGWLILMHRVIELSCKLIFNPKKSNQIYINKNKPLSTKAANMD